MIFLETSRLILRNLISEDAAVMYDYRNHDLCARYQRGQTKDLPGIVQLVENHSRDIITVDASYIVAVALKDSNEMIGEIVVMPNDGAITLGYTFSYKHHRKGYAYEALSAFTQMLHAQFPEWEFICFTDTENIASMKLLEKLGYEDFGYAEKITSQVFGKWITEGI
jgi:RimJ/RimL family protein N-acetyltransferase